MNCIIIVTDTNRPDEPVAFGPFPNEQEACLWAAKMMADNNRHAEHLEWHWQPLRKPA